MGGLGGLTPQVPRNFFGPSDGPQRSSPDLQSELRSLPLLRAGGAELLPLPQVLPWGGFARWRARRGTLTISVA